MKRTALALSILALSLPAAADEHQPFYGGVGLGQSNWQGVCLEGGDCNDTDFAFDIFAGYRFNDVIGVEAAYYDLGSPDWRNGNAYRKADARGGRLALVGLMPISHGFSLAGELGVAQYEAEMDTQAAYGVDNGFQPYIGAGFNYAINRSFEVGFRWRHFQEMETADELFNRHSANYWGAFFSYHFGGKAKTASKPAPQPVVQPKPQPKPVVVPPPPPPPPKPEVVEVAPSTVLYFDLNSSQVSGAELQKLTDIGRYMNAHREVTAELVGHTDSSGDADYNRWLGEKRAKAVQQQLLEVHGIHKDRVKVTSVGEQGAHEARSRSERKVTVNLTGMK